MASLAQAMERLITSFHILHRHNILNEGGSISIRHPSNPTTFITSSLPAILVSSPADLNERYVADGSLVQRPSNGLPTPPSDPSQSDPEIYVHCCLYNRYSGIHCIIHSPATDLVVYGLCDASGSMARCVFNNAGFVDEFSPIFDPTDYYSRYPTAHPENLLIDDRILGNALAESFITVPAANGFEAGRTVPDHSVAFVRGNGAVLWSATLESAVHSAVNLMRNARIQTTAMMQRNDSDIDITYLSGKEAAACRTASGKLGQSAWTAWATEVQRLPMYHNDLSVGS